MEGIAVLSHIGSRPEAGTLRHWVTKDTGALVGTGSQKESQLQPQSPSGNRVARAELERKAQQQNGTHLSL